VPKAAMRSKNDLIAGVRPDEFDVRDERGDQDDVDVAVPHTWYARLRSPQLAYCVLGAMVPKPRDRL